MQATEPWNRNELNMGLGIAAHQDLECPPLPAVPRVSGNSKRFINVSECFRGAAWGHLVMDRQQRFEHGSQATHAHLGCVPNEGNQARNSNLLQFLN